MCLFDLKCVNAIGQKSGKRGKKSVYVCVSVRECDTFFH